MYDFYQAKRWAQMNPSPTNCAHAALEALGNIRMMPAWRAWQWARLAEFWAIEAGIPEILIRLGDATEPNLERLREALEALRPHTGT